MEIVLTRVDDRSHELTVVRADGSSESRVLETRSLLLHDLAHLAVEAELGLHGGFFGTVAAGASIHPTEGRDPTADATPEAWLAESLAARLQSLANQGTDAEQVHRALSPVAPELVDRATAARIVERLRGHWAATPFVQSMAVHWPAAGEAEKAGGTRQDASRQTRRARNA